MKFLSERDKDMLIITLIIGFAVMCVVDVEIQNSLNKLTDTSLKLIKKIYLSFDCSYLIEQRQNTTNTQVWNNFLDDTLKQKGCMK